MMFYQKILTKKYPGYDVGILEDLVYCGTKSLTDKIDELNLDVVNYCHQQELMHYYKKYFI